MLERGSTFIAGLLIGLLAAGLLWLLIAEPRGQPVTLRAPPTPGPIRVHVSGEVAHPGVYALGRDSIVQAAIHAAGGPTAAAELTQINLAAKLHDGQQVFVPPANQKPGQVVELSEAPVLNAGPTSPGRININRAGASELELLPGIGPSLAAKIIEYREANGPFQTPQDLVDVAGIGPAKLEDLLDWIRLD
jgi:competence protein ComEA